MTLDRLRTAPHTPLPGTAALARAVPTRPLVLTARVAAGLHRAGAMVLYQVAQHRAQRATDALGDARWEAILHPSPDAAAALARAHERLEAAITFSVRCGVTD